MAEQQNDISAQSIMMLSMQRLVWVLFIITKIKKYNIWISRAIFAILEVLLILSEFYLQYVNRSVWEFCSKLIILQMSIQKPHHERNEDNWFQESWVLRIIRIKFWSHLNPWNLTLNAMRLLQRSHSIDFMKISGFQKWRQNISKTASGSI